MVTPTIMTNSSAVIIMIATNSMTSLSSTDSIITTPTGVTREQNDDNGSGVGGIIAGCVVVFIVSVAIVVCPIIFLIWYRAKKKGE